VAEKGSKEEPKQKKRKGFWAWVSSTSTVSFLEVATSLYSLEMSLRRMEESHKRNTELMKQQQQNP
jgi:pyrroloquinoline quinone (PQQ) biosynthesis protein C